MSWKRRALLALPAACVSCALFVGFDDYDVNPAYVLSEAGAGAESSTVGFHLAATPVALSLTRGQSAAVAVRVVRDPGFADPIAFDAPSLPGAGFSGSDGGASTDVLVFDVTGSIGASSSRITFHAHTAGRTQSLDVPVDVKPGSGDVDPAFGDGGVMLVEDAFPFGIARDPSGRVAVAVVRNLPGAVEQVVHAWSSAGVIDPTFGDAGTALLDHFTTGGTASPPEPGVLVGTSRGLVATTAHVLRRLSATGIADVTFADAGALGTPLYLPRVTTDGANLVFFGADVDIGENFATRVLGNGPPDTTFADAGVLDLGPYDMNTHAVPCARVVSGDLVLLLTSEPSNLPAQPATLRFGKSGAADSTFGDAGRHELPSTNVIECSISTDGGVTAGYGAKVIASSGGGDLVFTAAAFESISNVVWDPSGRLLVVGARNGLMFVARFRADGTPDTTFRAGALPYGISLPLDADKPSVLMEPDGALFLAVHLSATKALAVVRILP